ncbi:hypothetical protein OESDEN_11944 [Oesophagostomum dentatum]|uniref:Uncharacterized protein n=1 Tax=Oesophagostomum dentatum TaxID=61180 RepID=A0A0B1SYL3_OESDE|nr:hypothetical protein OESDEN_11944 [Oesophagostomum dentatum]
MVKNFAMCSDHFFEESTCTLGISRSRTRMCTTTRKTRHLTLTRSRMLPYCYSNPTTAMTYAKICHHFLG